MLIKTAKLVTGHRTGLGKPSKMPGYSTSLPASACKVGAKLAKVAGSVCASCYAMRGHYIYPDVRDGLQRRLDALNDPQWVDGMVKLVGHYTDPTDPYFRIHDSGDFQSVDHILRWVAVADALPWVHFWAPSRELRMVKVARGMAANGHPTWWSDCPHRWSARPLTLPVQRQALTLTVATNARHQRRETNAATVAHAGTTTYPA